MSSALGALPMPEHSIGSAVPWLGRYWVFNSTYVETPALTRSALDTIHSAISRWSVALLARARLPRLRASLGLKLWLRSQPSDARPTLG